MKLNKLCAAGILAGAVLANAPVQAAAPTPADAYRTAPTAAGPTLVSHRGWHRGWDSYYLAPREVRRILRHHGFRHIKFIDRRGDTYRAFAENWRGRDMFIRVSSRTGEIISVERADPVYGPWY